MRSIKYWWNRWRDSRENARNDRNGTNQGTSLEIEWSGETFVVDAIRTEGACLIVMDRDGKHPEGLAVSLNDAVNRARYRSVFKNLYDPLRTFYWPDGSKVTTDELIGY